MTPDEMHGWLEGWLEGEGNEPPFVLKTIGGRSYEITARANVWLPDAYPDMLCVAVLGRGIAVIRIATIESIHIE
jgi:hypothetical protein